jgi:GT2 family glycosyltransferase
MTNVVMIARDRHRLTEQALKSLYVNTPKRQYTLVLMDDGSGYSMENVLMRLDWEQPETWISLRLGKPTGIVGLNRNLGAWFSERYFVRGEYLCFADNDVYFRPGWLAQMTETMKLDPNLAILGGQRHPYHGINQVNLYGHVEETDAVAGYAMMMRWDVWEAVGPFDAHAKGLGQSEDYALCRKAYAQGMYVGYHNPPTILHTGMTDTNGKPIAGAEQFERFEGVLYA